MITPGIKSFGTSLALHLFALAAVCVFHATPEPFTPSGQTQVISIQATQSSGARAVDVQVEPIAKPAFDPLPGLIPSSPDARVCDETMEQPEFRSDSSPRPAESMPETLLATMPMLQRKPAAEMQPAVAVEDEVTERSKVTKPLDAPTVVSNPMAQLVGIEKERLADLSQNQPPPYPAEAIQRRLEGVVLLELQVSSQGTVTDVSVVESSGHAVLDKAAIKAVASWTGEPAKRWGRAIESTTRLPIRFRL